MMTSISGVFGGGVVVGLLLSSNECPLFSGFSASSSFLLRTYNHGNYALMLDLNG